jgi:hypothetical protein
MGVRVWIWSIAISAIAQWIMEVLVAKLLLTSVFPNLVETVRLVSPPIAHFHVFVRLGLMDSSVKIQHV